jgi:hypothetical protein
VDWSLNPEKWFGAGLVRKRIFMLAVIKEHRYGPIAHMDKVTDFYSVAAGLSQPESPPEHWRKPQSIAAFCNLFDDATRTAARTEPEETGHFGTTADKRSQRRFQDDVAARSWPAGHVML